MHVLFVCFNLYHDITLALAWREGGKPRSLNYDTLFLSWN
jgi:hypothetical protein